MHSMFPVDFLDVGRQIQQRRRELGLTQEQVADELHMTSTQLSRIECGQRPSLQTLLHLTSALNLSLDSLFCVYLTADQTTAEIHRCLMEFTPKQRRLFLCCLRCVLQNRSKGDG